MGMLVYTQHYFCTSFPPHFGVVHLTLEKGSVNEWLIILHFSYTHTLIEWCYSSKCCVTGCNMYSSHQCWNKYHDKNTVGIQSVRPSVNHSVTKYWTTWAKKSKSCIWKALCNGNWCVVRNVQSMQHKHSKQLQRICNQTWKQFQRIEKNNVSNISLFLTQTDSIITCNISHFSQLIIPGSIL